MNKLTKTALILILVGIILIVSGLFAGAKLRYDLPGKGAFGINRLDDNISDDYYSEDWEFDEDDYYEDIEDIDDIDDIKLQTLDIEMDKRHWISEETRMVQSNKVKTEKMEFDKIEDVVLEIPLYSVEIVGISGNKPILVYETIISGENQKNPIIIEQTDETSIHITGSSNLEEVIRKLKYSPKLVLFAPNGELKTLETSLDLGKQYIKNIVVEKGDINSDLAKLK